MQASIFSGALPAGIPHGRTRALLKIEDGCNNFCTYCIIPYARGRVRSLPVEQALEQTARLADAGVHEIVLTGIEIASYGKDFEPQVPLTELLEKLLTAQPNVQFRLGSLDPRAVDDVFVNGLPALPISHGIFICLCRAAAIPFSGA